jgi:hypothetical protein
VLSSGSSSGSQRPNLPDLASGYGMGCFVQIPSELQVQPELRLDAKEAFEPQRSVGRHIPLSMHQFIDARIRNPDSVGEFALRKAKGLEKLLQKHFAGVRRRSVRWNANHTDS